VLRFMERKRIDDAYELKQKCIAHFYRRGHGLDMVKRIIDEEYNK